VVVRAVVLVARAELVPALAQVVGRVRAQGPPTQRVGHPQRVDHLGHLLAPVEVLASNRQP
jgi:hypothetical protein